MVDLIISPTWFVGIDAAFDTISVIVAILISIFSFRIYRFTSQKRYLALSGAYLLICFSFLIKIVTSLSIYFQIFAQKVGPTILVRYSPERIQLLASLGLTSFQLMMLLGFLMIYGVLWGISDKRVIFLLLYLGTMMVLFSDISYYAFHATNIILLAFIVWKLKLNYNEKKTNLSRYVMIGFSLIVISQLFFLFIHLSKELYVFGESFQLLGYALLLFASIKVLRK